MNAPTIYPQLEEQELAYLLEELSIYHNLLSQGKRWNPLSKQSIWSLLCR